MLWHFQLRVCLQRRIGTHPLMIRLQKPIRICKQPVSLELICSVDSVLMMVMTSAQVGCGNLQPLALRHTRVASFYGEGAMHYCRLCNIAPTSWVYSRRCHAIEMVYRNGPWRRCRLLWWRCAGLNPRANATRARHLHWRILIRIKMTLFEPLPAQLWGRQHRPTLRGKWLWKMAKMTWITCAILTIQCRRPQA